MNLSLTWNGVSREVDLKSAHDLSIPLRDEFQGDSPAAWYVGRPRFEPVKGDGFTGSVKEGGAVNFTNVYFNPHGHGTHTECLGHITKEAESVDLTLRNSVRDRTFCWLMVCHLVSLTPEEIDGDLVITKNSFQSYLKDSATFPKALIIRTLPNTVDKKKKNWANTNPPYLDCKLTALFVKLGIEHLLIDLPSVDKEVDSGALLSHRAFFGVPERPRTNATITEFIFIPDVVKDGLYALNLQVAPFDLDAAPSRPVIFPLK